VNLSSSLAGRGAARGPASLVALMVIAVAAVTALAFWDDARESADALDDFAQDQTTLAGSVASEIETRLRVIDADAPPAKLLEGTHVERAGAVRILVRGPRDSAMRATDGGVVSSEPIQRALDAGQASVWLDRPQAAAVGLPARRAAAGLAVVDAGPRGRWGVAVVSSAVRVRDREQRARLRLVFGVLVSAGLVFLFGSEALRRQRRGLLLERELALAALARERDAELATANRAAVMGTLAMGIAHEVSTPLGVIAGRAEQLAARSAGDERAARAVQAIVEQSEHIRRVVRGFLDLARGEQPVLGDSAPGAVLEGAIALVEHRFAAAGVALVREVPGGLPAIHCDVQMLQQAIVNLLLNACDACARGGRVEARVEGEGEHVVFTVIDDGIGITPEAAARATEPFFTTKAQGQGTGIGLAITSEIVKLHRGTLSLRPASPRGTSATLILPTPKATRHAAA
jgi:two-component system NtrC family sensor kinase